MPHLSEEEMEGTGFRDQFPKPGFSLVLREAANGLFAQLSAGLRPPECLMNLAPVRVRVRCEVTADGRDVGKCYSSWKCITYSTPNPEFHEYCHLPPGKLGWTAESTPRIEVTLTLEISHIWLPTDNSVGDVRLDTLPSDVGCGLLDVSKSCWHRKCRPLDMHSDAVSTCTSLSPVIEFDVISWPPGQQRPPRASIHPHKPDLDILLSVGLGVREVPEDFRKQIVFDTTVGPEAHDQEWSIEIGDVNHYPADPADNNSRSNVSRRYSGKLSPISMLTIPPAVRERLGIPSESTHFCFAYGDSSGVGRDRSFGGRLDAMVLQGAFVYFQNKGLESELELHVTSIKTTIDRVHDDHTSAKTISLSEWKIVPDHVVQAMKSRFFHAIPHPTLLTQGFKTYSFVTPLEHIDGNLFPYTGFLYTFHDGSKAIIIKFSKNAKEDHSHRMSIHDNKLSALFSVGPFTAEAVVGTEVNLESKQH